MPVSFLLFEFMFSIDNIYYDRVPSLTILGDHLLTMQIKLLLKKISFHTFYPRGGFWLFPLTEIIYFCIVVELCD